MATAPPTSSTTASFQNKTCGCSNYISLSNPNRSVLNRRSHRYCDKKVADNRSVKYPQWQGANCYRFEGSMQRMANQNEVKWYKMCNTNAGGYVEDPNVHDQLQSGQTIQDVKVCFFYSVFEPCRWKTKVDITRCPGDYFVYKLPETPGCPLAYCGQN